MKIRKTVVAKFIELEVGEKIKYSVRKRDTYRTTRDRLRKPKSIYRDRVFTLRKINEFWLEVTRLK